MSQVGDPRLLGEDQVPKLRPSQGTQRTGWTGLKLRAKPRQLRFKAQLKAELDRLTHGVHWQRFLDGLAPERTRQLEVFMVHQPRQHERRRTGELWILAKAPSQLDHAVAITHGYRIVDRHQDTGDRPFLVSQLFSFLARRMYVAQGPSARHTSASNIQWQGVIQVFMLFKEIQAKVRPARVVGARRSQKKNLGRLKRLNQLLGVIGHKRPVATPKGCPPHHETGMEILRLCPRNFNRPHPGLDVRELDYPDRVGPLIGIDNFGCRGLRLLCTPCRQ